VSVVSVLAICLFIFLHLTLCRQRVFVEEMDAAKSYSRARAAEWWQHCGTPPKTMHTVFIINSNKVLFSSPRSRSSSATLVKRESTEITSSAAFRNDTSEIPPFSLSWPSSTPSMHFASSVSSTSHSLPSSMPLEHFAVSSGMPLRSQSLPLDIYQSSPLNAYHDASHSALISPTLAAFDSESAPLSPLSMSLHMLHEGEKAKALQQSAITTCEVREAHHTDVLCVNTSNTSNTSKDVNIPKIILSPAGVQNSARAAMMTTPSADMSKLCEHFQRHSNAHKRYMEDTKGAEFKRQKTQRQTREPQQHVIKRTTSVSKRLFCSSPATRTHEAITAFSTCSRVVKCNCIKSQCQKLYCECFAAGSTCGEHCGCTSCKNDVKRVHISQAADKSASSLLLLADATASSNISNPSPLELPQQKHIRCSCKKSMCARNYCDCFKFKLVCTDKCGCIECLNHSSRTDTVHSASCH
jgi:hypothetical protein